MKQMAFFLIIVILLFSLYGSFNLSLVDFQEKDICPKMLGIPACYIVFVFFLLTLISHIWTRRSPSYLLYYLFLAIPFLMALSGTISELSGKVVCPRTPGGTPMCYISLGICTLLIVIKLVETKYKR